jgi:MarR family transcriptional regulator for hemolysin
MVQLERAEGLKQSELAEILDLQPITLTRLIDRLCDNGLIERRSDPNDRRAKRLFLTPGAIPLLDRLDKLGTALMTDVLDGIPPERTDAMLSQLDAMKENLRRALHHHSEAASEKRKTYG